jgi:hypothetical protein
VPASRDGQSQRSRSRVQLVHLPQILSDAATLEGVGLEAELAKLGGHILLPEPGPAPEPEDPSFPLHDTAGLKGQRHALAEVEAGYPSSLKSLEPILPLTKRNTGCGDDPLIVLQMHTKSGPRPGLPRFGSGLSQQGDIHDVYRAASAGTWRRSIGSLGLDA